MLCLKMYLSSLIHYLLTHSRPVFPLQAVRRNCIHGSNHTLFKPASQMNARFPTQAKFVELKCWIVLIRCQQTRKQVWVKQRTSDHPDEQHICNSLCSCIVHPGGRVTKGILAVCPCVFVFLSFRGDLNIWTGGELSPGLWFCRGLICSEPDMLWWKLQILTGSTVFWFVG